VHNAKRTRAQWLCVELQLHSQAALGTAYYCIRFDSIHLELRRHKLPDLLETGRSWPRGSNIKNTIEQVDFEGDRNYRDNRDDVQPDKRRKGAKNRG